MCNESVSYVYFFILYLKPSGETTKTMDIKCCDMDTLEDTCSLGWGSNPSYEPLAQECVPGCVPNSATDSNSQV